MATMKEVAKRGGAQRGGRDWQHAFVASFPGTPLDESHYAKEVADHLGVPATFIKIDPVEAMGRLEEFFYLFQDLYITSPIPFMLTYGAVKKAGISVSLDGHGADELFGGYSFDYLFALRDAGASVGQALGIIRTFYDAWPKETQQFPALPHPLLYWGRWHLAYLKSKLIGRPTVAVGTASADATFRCGSKIVVTGMTQSEVLQYCGEPTSNTEEVVPVRSGNQVVGEARHHRWTYTSYGATRVLVFDQDTLKSIE